MPVYQVQAPSGKVYSVEGPEGASPEQLGQFILSQNQSERVAMTRTQMAQEVNPTNDMGTLERLRAGVGRGMASVGRGIGNLVGLVSDADMAESKRLDEALMNTRAGKVGSVVGNVAAAAPTAFIPGANTYVGAGLIGAGWGGLTTEGDAKERAQGAGWGLLGGLLGKGAGDALGAGARKVADVAQAKYAANTAANAQKMQAAQAMAKEGYVIPPSELQPNMLTEALSGLSGKIKTAQVASQKNQEVTNRLAREALGLPPDAPLTADALNAVRQSAASNGYTPIRGAGQVTADQTYGNALDNIVGQYQGAARSFPNAVQNPVQDLVGGLRQQKFDAGDALDMIKVLRERADTAFRSGDSALGRASKEAAGAIESQLERHLAAAGNPDALAAFQAARQQIAKTYTVGKALNQTTGDVSAPVLARELAKGKPLSGELRTIAEAAAAQPKAMQALTQAPNQLSPLDWAMSLGAGSMHPAGLATLAARPAARAYLLSPTAQAAALRGAAPPALSQVPAKLLDQDLARAMSPGLLAALLTSE